MTLEEATPLISAVGEVVLQLISRVIASQHMSDDEKSQALKQVAAMYDATTAKIAALQIK